MRACDDKGALWVRFDCRDERIVATHTRRDEPLFEAEVVEVFPAPGADPPLTCAELEVSPAGVPLDARVNNTDGRRNTLLADPPPQPFPPAIGFRRSLAGIRIVAVDASESSIAAAHRYGIAGLLVAGDVEGDRAPRATAGEAVR